MDERLRELNEELSELNGRLARANGLERRLDDLRAQYEERKARVEETVAQLREERGLTETPPWTISYYPAEGPVGLIEFVMGGQELPASGENGENLAEES